MSTSLSFNDTIRRVGFTTIDGVKVVQYDCTIPSDKPEDMRIITTKLNHDMYKANRDVCRDDLAEFEDGCYAMQDQYIENMKQE
jgi:hypothetical protein